MATKTQTRLTADIVPRLSPAQIDALKSTAASTPVKYRLPPRVRENTRLSLVARGLVAGVSLTAAGERVMHALLKEAEVSPSPLKMKLIELTKAAAVCVRTLEVLTFLPPQRREELRNGDHALNSADVRYQQLLRLKAAIDAVLSDEDGQ